MGKERVSCVGGCGKEVVIMLENEEDDKKDLDEKPSSQDGEDVEDEWREQAQAQLVEKYAEMITSAHDEGCLWRRRGCDGKLSSSSIIWSQQLNLRPRHNTAATFSAPKHRN